MSQESKHAAVKPRRRRWLRRLMIGGATLVIVALTTPYIASSDLFRDRVINAAVGDTPLNIESRSASFGWMTPVTVEEVTLRSPDRRLSIQVDQLRTDKSWWELWLNPNRLGHVELIAPRAEVDLDWQDFNGYAAGEIPRFSATLDDASLFVKLKQMQGPVIDLDAFDLSMRVEKGDVGDFLIIDDAIVLNNRQITAETCSELLQLVDPMLGEVVQAEGEFTLQVDRLKIPLNVDAAEQQRRMSLAGRLELHRVTTKATTPLLKGVVRVAADMHDFPPTEIVRVVNQSDIEFEIRGGRLYHAGLQFGLPDIDAELVVQSEGSVGLDESLDVHVTIPKLFLNEKPEPAATTVDMAQLHITGTIAEPIVKRLDRSEENIQNGISQR